MPFTFSHPALVIPLYQYAKKYVSLTGLFVGTMVPDFEFIFSLRETKSMAHHFPSYILFNIPVAIMFCYLYHNILRNFLCNNLPHFLKSRLLQFNHFDWNQFAKKNVVTILLSICIGIFLHLFWDSFTHFDGFIVLHWMSLQQKILILKRPIAIYNILQVLFSVLGLWYVLRFILKIEKQKLEESNKVMDKLFWLKIIVLFFMFLLLRFYFMAQFKSNSDIMLAIIGCSLYSWLVISFLNYFSKNNKNEINFQ